MKLKIGVLMCVVAFFAAYGGRNRPTFGPPPEVTLITLIVENITEVTEIILVDGGKIGNSGKGNIKFNETDSELYILDGDLGVGTEVLEAGTKVTTTEDTADADLFVEFQADAAADNSDLWRHHYADGGDYTLESFATGSWVVVETISNVGLFTPIDLVIPQATPAVPAVDGAVEIDFTDGTLVVQHGSAHAELASATDVVMGKLIKSWSRTLAFPDLLQAEIDNWPLKEIDAAEFPHGIVVTQINLKTSASSTFAVNVENWSDPTTIDGSNPTIDAITTSGSTEASETTITYSTIAAGQIIMLDLPATDLSWVTITVFYYEPAA